MRKTIIGATILAALLPFAASAATVEVYPTITNSHGAQKSAADMQVCISYNGTQNCQSGVPTFTVPDGASYSVTVNPASGYSYTTDSACTGVANGAITCNVDYADGAPVAPQPTVTAATIPQVSAPAQIQTASVSAPAGGAAATTTLTEAQQIAALQAEIQQLYQILIALLQQKLAVIK